MYYDLTIQYPLNEIEYKRINSALAMQYINSYLALMNTGYTMYRHTFNNLTSRASKTPKIVRYFLSNNKIKISRAMHDINESV
jgi:hypothetical protein